MSSVSCLSLCLGLNLLDSLQLINALHFQFSYSCSSFRLTVFDVAYIHQYDVRFVFTCISLLPIVLSMTKECRYSVHIVILSIGLNPKCSQTSIERKPKCAVALLLSEVQYNMWFSFTGQLQDNILLSALKSW